MDYEEVAPGDDLHPCSLEIKIPEALNESRKSTEATPCYSKKERGQWFLVRRR